MAAQFRFLHLAVNFKTKSPTTETLGEIETVLNKAKDWYRYIPNCWLIYTSVDSKTWAGRLKKQIPWMSEEQFLTCAVDLKEKSGWLPRDTWTWINQDRTS